MPSAKREGTRSNTKACEGAMHGKGGEAVGRAQNTHRCVYSADITSCLLAAIVRRRRTVLMVSANRQYIHSEQKSTL